MFCSINQTGLPFFKRLVVVGLGLIGSSILRRVQQDGKIAEEVVAADHDVEVCARVSSLGIADRVEQDIGKAADGADCVILCVPVGVMGELAEIVCPVMRKNGILSDVGSTKRSVIQQVEPHLRQDTFFVPTHPMAGTEHSGPDAGFPTLFENRWTLLTPIRWVPDCIVETMECFWQHMGSRVRRMTAEDHDRICALVSHLPHFLAFTICETVNNFSKEARSDVFDFAASGFRDFTRIAGSDPLMWRDIFLNNSDTLLEIVNRFTGDIERLKVAIQKCDGDYIVSKVKQGRKIRQILIDKHQA